MASAEDRCIGSEIEGRVPIPGMPAVFMRSGYSQWNGWILGFLGLLIGQVFVGGAIKTLPVMPPDPAQLARMQRTSAILHRSTPERRGRLYVIFYGQSITLEPWTRTVSDVLTKAFPAVDFTFENRAISGFQADKLAVTAVADLIDTQPDLVILHDYGFEPDMERLVKTIRSRCHADILLQTDHPYLPGDIDEPTDPATLSPTNAWAYRNAVTLPRLASQYRCALADVREYFKAYLRLNNLKEKDLLGDTVHHNADGNALMATNTLRYFEAPPIDLQFSPDANATVSRIAVDPTDFWVSQTLDVEFTGHRVEAILSSNESGSVVVTLDGKSPSTRSELYTHTRPSDTHTRPWPAASLITHRKALVEESWTLTLTRVNTNGTVFDFRVDGTRTGLDGEGSNSQDFVSDSGRVGIYAGSWWIPFASTQTRSNPPVGFQVTWNTVFHGSDRIVSKNNLPEDRETVQVLASGLSDDIHTLRLTQTVGTRHPLKALRVFSASGNARVRRVSDVIPDRGATLGTVLFQSGPQLYWPSSQGTRLLQSSRGPLSNPVWTPITVSPRRIGDYYVWPLNPNQTQQFYKLP